MAGYRSSQPPSPTSLPALAAKDPGQASAVAPAIDPRKAEPLRRDQPFILIETKRPGGDPELVAELADGVGADRTVRLAIIGMERLGHDVVFPEELVVVFMTQLMPSGSFNFRGQLKSIIYPAIVD